MVAGFEPGLLISALIFFPIWHFGEKVGGAYDDMFKMLEIWISG